MSDSEMPKLIDFERKGNVVRLYLGRSGLREWYGDDWDDTPYEHNAETVYAEYVIGWLDVALGWQMDVFEPADGHVNSHWCKDDMVAGRVAMLAVFRESDFTLTPFGFEDVTSARGTVLLHMGESLDEAVGALCATDVLGMRANVARYEDDAWTPSEVWSHALDAASDSDGARLCEWARDAIAKVPVRESEQKAMA